MLNNNKKLLVIAVAAGVASFGTFTAHAEDFGASSTLINTLSVTNINDLDIGSVFASTTGTALANGVAALTVAADGAVSEPADSAEINMISLSTAVPAQASVDNSAEFNLILPDTSTINAADFVDDATATSLVNITNGTGNAVELIHDSANPDVPSLWLMHFTVADVSGGVVTEVSAGSNDGDYSVVPSFGEATYVFTIGATVTTEPSTTGQLVYQEGTYAGTFSVTASY